MNEQHNNQIKAPKTNSRRGQTSLVMILILAVAFIFYAITLNWSRIANLKTNTWMAAVSASSQAASMFTSYGERVIKEQLEPLGGLDYNGGNLEYCKGSFFLLQILFAIIAIVLAYFTAGMSIYLAVALLAVMVASIVVQEFVIAPTMLNAWNKLYSNLLPADQYREQALATAMQQIVNDPVGLPDRFDLNANGKWGFTGNVFNDQISRYGLFYTERLKFIKPPDIAALESFRGSLKTLVEQPVRAALPPGSTELSGLGFVKYCTSGSTLSQCNPVCTDLNNRPRTVRQGTGINWQYPPPVPINYVPAECGVCNINISPTCPPFLPAVPLTNYRLLYDPSLEQPTADPLLVQSSLRGRLGHDDEIGKSLINGSPIPGAPLYNNDSAHVKGIVFPFLNEMTVIDPTLHTFNLLNALPGVSVGNTAPAVRFFDTIPTLTNYYAQNNQCGQSQSSAGGFFWKKGADQYCSGPENTYPDYAELIANGVIIQPSDRHFSYADCQYMFNGTNFVGCGAAGTDPTLWPQDRLDAMVNNLSNLVKANGEIQKIESAVLVSSLPQWYQKVAPFIAPRCSSTPADPYSAAVNTFLSTNPSLSYLLTYAGKPNVCNPDEHGYMIQWLYDSTNWANSLNNPPNGWLNRIYGGPTDLCSGTIGQIGTCLQNNALYLTELRDCQSNFPAPIPDPGGGPPTYPPTMSAQCTTVINLYNSTPSAFLAPLPGGYVYAPNAASYQTLLNWVNDNVIMKTEVQRISQSVINLNNYGNNIYNLFDEATVVFRKFLEAEGPANILMRTVNNQITSIRRLPSFIIYGWKDPKPVGALWHLARAEAKEPSKLPYVRAHKEGSFFDRETCFTYTDGNDDVWVRATRWDQDFNAGTALFANGVQIWKFSFKNPTAAPVSYTAGDLDNDCIKNGIGVGLTEDTLYAYTHVVPPLPALDSSSDEGKNMSKAFMINLDPSYSPPPDDPPVDGCTFNINSCGDESTYTACCTLYSNAHGYVGDTRINYCMQSNYTRCIQNKKNAELRIKLGEIRQCYEAASALLNVGVKSSAGAHYGVPNAQPWHSGIFFHSSSTTKNTGIFGNSTFNDVPTSN